MNLIHKIFIRINGWLAGGMNDDLSSKYISGVFYHVISGRKPVSQFAIRKKIYPVMTGDFPLLTMENRIRINGWFEMMKQLKDVKGAIVEAGTGYGNTAVTLVAANRFYQVQKEIHCFDSFEGFPVPHEYDQGARVKKGHQLKGWEENSQEIVLEAAEHDPFLTIHAGYFNNTMQYLPDSISLLHVDCDLYESALCVLQNAYPKLSPGAFVIIDEYHDEKWPGVKKGVDEFLLDKPEKIRYFEGLLRYGFIKSGI